MLDEKSEVFVPTFFSELKSKCRLTRHLRKGSGDMEIMIKNGGGSISTTATVTNAKTDHPTGSLLKVYTEADSVYSPRCVTM